MNKNQKVALIVFSILLTMLLATTSFAKTLKVAVLDTGFDMNSKWSDHEKRGIKTLPKLCPEGLHRNYSSDIWLNDTHGHGTHIAGIIGARTNPEVDYCLIIVKYFNLYGTGEENQIGMNAALRYAVEEANVDIINISGGGELPDPTEKKLIMQALNKGIKIVVAAGNNSLQMDNKKNCRYYPACYSTKVISVSNALNPNSNRGIMVQSMQNGNNVKSIVPNNGYSLMSGTSQSAAIQTAELLNEMGGK